MKIVADGCLATCAALLVTVALRPLWLHVGWSVRQRRSRKRHGGML